MSAELGPSTRALLAAAKEGMSPDAAALARVRAKVGAAVGAGGAAAATATAAKMSLAAKLTIALLAVGAVAGGVVVVQKTRSVAVETPVAAPAVHADEEVAGMVVTQAAVEPAAPVGAVEKDVVAPKRIAVTPTPTTTLALAPTIEGKTEAKIAEPAKVATLAREVELVDQAMKELRAGNEHGALTTLHTYATETAGRGQLAEDASAIEVEALCRIGDVRGPARFADFDHLWPHSAQRNRLVEACK